MPRWVYDPGLLIVKGVAVQVQVYWGKLFVLIAVQVGMCWGKLYQPGLLIPV